MYEKKQLKNYETIKAVIDPYLQQQTLDGAEIQQEIKDKLEVGDSFDKYAGAVSDYVGLAIEISEPRIKEIFIKVFFQDLEKYGMFFLVTSYAMALEGLFDLINLDFHKLDEYAEDEDDVTLEKILSEDYPTESPESDNDKSQLMMLRKIYHSAKFNIPLLIIGETGTSKELLVRAIHTISERRNRAFLEINCAAIPENLLEAELFGVIPDYPGLLQNREMDGKILRSNGGIIFLDELGRMPMRLQEKILKVIEENRVTRLGAEESTEIDVRFIAATQPSTIKNIIPDIKFRLGYPNTINLPTLNERIDKIGDFIIENSLDQVLKKMGLQDKNISLNVKAKNILKNHTYEGNYRELENILRGAIISTMIDERKEIVLKDITGILDANKRNDSVTESETKTSFLYPEDIKTSEIIGYADKIKASIVEAKILEVLRSGKNLKRSLLSEGKTHNDYQNFRKKVTQITGQNIRELSKKASLS